MLITLDENKMVDEAVNLESVMSSQRLGSLGDISSSLSLKLRKTSLFFGFLFQKSNLVSSFLNCSPCGNQCFIGAPLRTFCINNPLSRCRNTLVLSIMSVEESTAAAAETTSGISSIISPVPVQRRGRPLWTIIVEWRYRSTTRKD